MSRFETVSTAFDAIHAQDPTGDAGIDYHQRVATWVDTLNPEASEALRIAARAQHIRRWGLPRDDFPAGRVGYLKWRGEQGRAHAAEAAKILTDAGYDDAIVSTVGDLLRKRHLRNDPEAQTLEDAACLVFIETQLEAFAAKHPSDKLTVILQKTWAKMSPAGQQAGLTAVEALPEALAATVKAAL